jgi:cytochrome b involved in lipid metabolism
MSVSRLIGFADEHPGGAKILKRAAGKDASKTFWKVSLPRDTPQTLEYDALEGTKEC